MGMPDLEIYSMISAEGFGRLVAAFYRQVPQDDLLGPIYPASDLLGADCCPRRRHKNPSALAGVDQASVKARPASCRRFHSGVQSMYSIRFSDPATLREELVQLGLLR
jgi:truncated hemoglobin YjbI